MITSAASNPSSRSPSSNVLVEAMLDGGLAVSPLVCWFSSISGASGEHASITSSTTGNGSYSTLISFRASSATDALVAATAATAWPW